MLLIAPPGYGGAPRTPIVRCMPGGHSTLNTVVLGEGVSKSKYTPYFGHHSRLHAAAQLAYYIRAGIRGNMSSYIKSFDNMHN